MESPPPRTRRRGHLSFSSKSGPACSQHLPWMILTNAELCASFAGAPTMPSANQTRSWSGYEGQERECTAVIKCFLPCANHQPHARPRQIYTHQTSVMIPIVSLSLDHDI